MISLKGRDRLLIGLGIVTICLMGFLLFVWGYPVHPPLRSPLLGMNPMVEFSPVDEPIQPIPSNLNLNPQKVALGQRLFKEPLLSRDGKLACVSCHSLTPGGTDRQTHWRSVNGKAIELNTLTVFNSKFNYKLSWYGEFDSLEGQLDEAISNPNGMGMNWERAIANLKNSPEYVKAFGDLYPQGITTDTVKNALATFERSLYTPNARFDRFLLGDDTAITEEEKAGYQIFKNYGCASCHQGVNVGGNLLQKFGILGNYFADRNLTTQADLGRYNLTDKEEDRYVFRVPSLRNASLGGPYFHDGSASTLNTAIAVMAKYQLGRQLSAEQIDLIIKFLQTLNGEYEDRQ